MITINLSGDYRFQSTRPRRGAIARYHPFRAVYNVSIHAPPEGRDANHFCSAAAVTCFNPRAPGGAR